MRDRITEVENPTTDDLRHAARFRVQLASLLYRGEDNGPAESVPLHKVSSSSPYEYPVLHKDVDSESTSDTNSM